CYIQNCLRV
uniref:Conopressin-T n=1 Tax=Conus tulipa TaxID=6495 RepID=CONOT_CONTU|nr:RecName: Full=Conopressin-T; Short=Con-T [Conus tulipa]